MLLRIKQLFHTIKAKFHSKRVNYYTHWGIIVEFVIQNQTLGKFPQTNYQKGGTEMKVLFEC